MSEISWGNPASCGYLYHAELNRWVRPWSGESIHPRDKPEWDRFIDEKEDRE